MWLVGTSDLPGNLPFRLEEGQFLLGRSNGCDILIFDLTVSRRHARITHLNRVLRVVDLQSSNGVWVNECRVNDCELQVGDHLRFGCVSCAVCSSPLAFHQKARDDEEGTYRLQRENGSTVRVEGLTPAQIRVLRWMLQGKGEDEIAEILDKSPHTIHTHVKAIFERLSVHSRSELLVKLLPRR